MWGNGIPTTICRPWMARITLLTSSHRSISVPGLLDSATSPVCRLQHTTQSLHHAPNTLIGYIGEVAASRDQFVYISSNDTTEVKS